MQQQKEIQTDSRVSEKHLKIFPSRSFLFPWYPDGFSSCCACSPVIWCTFAIFNLRKHFKISLNYKNFINPKWYSWREHKSFSRTFYGSKWIKEFSFTFNNDFDVHRTQKFHTILNLNIDFYYLAGLKGILKTLKSYQNIQGFYMEEIKRFPKYSLIYSSDFKFKTRFWKIRKFSIK